jgi:anaerobic ribonucleoside-triphosphate reductase activating protein
MKLIRISGIEPESIVDGEGIRYVIFAQGCPHHCPGCHNPQTHPFGGGKLVSIEDILDDISKRKNWIDGIIAPQQVGGQQGLSDLPVCSDR